MDAYLAQANAVTPAGIERDWEAFVAKAGGEKALLYADVPFPLLPPRGGPSLDATAHTLAAAGAWLGIFQFSTASGGPRDRTQEEQRIKRQVRQAYLRWHPDKFQQAFGQALDGGERDKVLAQVTLVAQHISRLKDMAKSYLDSFS
jgi:hypothetical protein